MYENYGCEFLDLETHREPKLKDDWIWLPISFLEKTIDNAYNTGILATKESYLRELEESIKINTLQNPGLLIIGSNQIKLQDGNHRFIILKRMGFSHFPVKLEFSSGKIKNGVALQDLVEELICLLTLKEPYIVYMKQ